ncbi:energy-coupling factor transporter ATP-binding protein EcfA2 [Clostridium polyendosporum]|uniref:Energy-coupling factor transporter ATP-binding protein EcfA2 n=1 Tax=Clostridium polyendosporum TaxID=69208 RepID=A0A919RZU6_9CLOT|nr:ATP-binding cassette domain-containing protein [Clostridium polyendosporum]GIM29242.1 energy-coupling factor transporter ATP-binding protein EcfA2 [Clostridium polyendosporum]
MQIIEVKNLTYTYYADTPHERKLLDNITFSVEKGAVLGIIGENGSGKSTLLKHFNGTLQPTDGSIKVLGKEISNRQDRNELWKKVGMVFQFPEQQIFEDTVFNEIAYGLKNLGLSKEEIVIRVKEALDKVGLDNEYIEKLPPLSLSGGGRRRVAIASVLAMQPEVLILDESTAGLDLLGREKIIDIIKKIKEDRNTTIIIVSHNLSELISVCSHIAVLKDGKLVSFGVTSDVLSQKTIINMYYKMFPDYIQLMHRLSERYENVNTRSINLEDIEIELDKLLLRGVKNGHA